MKRAWASKLLLVPLVAWMLPMPRGRELRRVRDMPPDPGGERLADRLQPFLVIGDAILFGPDRPCTTLDGSDCVLRSGSKCRGWDSNPEGR